jgi:RNA polymerase sigma factor (sigma-70 family)
MESAKLIDYDIFLRFKNGDRDAFKNVYVSYVNQLIYFCKSLLSEGESKVWSEEDIVAETFYRLFKYKEKLRNPGHLHNLLFRICRNQVGDIIDRQKLDKRVMKAIGGIQYEVQRTEDRIPYSAWKKSVESLAPRQRQIYDMMFVHGMPNRQISYELKLSSQTVTNVRQQVISKFRKHITK